MSEFSNRLLKRRLQLGYTQEDVSKMIGITQSSYSRIEHGLQEPNLTQLKKISEKLNVSLDYLLDCDTPFYNNQINSDIKEQIKIIYENYIAHEKNCENEKD